MTKSEFEELQLKFKASGMTLKSFLKTVGVAYSSYNYWSHKAKDEGQMLPIAPIELRTNYAQTQTKTVSMSDVEIPGVTISFPNGVRAHFGRGSEGVLVDVLTKSMDHVLPQ